MAELVRTPKGQPGRPSKAVIFNQATAMLEAAREFRLHAYVVVSLLTGIRTEEARALLWSHVMAWVTELGEWRPVTEAGFDHERYQHPIGQRLACLALAWRNRIALLAR